MKIAFLCLCFPQHLLAVDFLCFFLQQWSATLNCANNTRQIDGHAAWGGQQGCRSAASILLVEITAINFHLL